MKTEATNIKSINLDQLSSLELVTLFNEEDKRVNEAINQAQEQIADCIEAIYKKFSEHINDVLNPKMPYTGPRLFYLGAGTSGRLGVLDAAECPPTFSVPKDMVQGIIAGGEKAIQNSIEGAEDNNQAGYDFVTNELTEKDVLVGISASGGAPYVLGALKACKEKNILSIAVANNPDALSFGYASKNIFLDTGAEIIAGSTRLKAGTAQKLCLNMISSSLMIKLGKVYQNLMVDVNASNNKLIKRATSLVMKITNCSEQKAIDSLEQANMQVKTAVVMINKKCDFETAEQILQEKLGRLRDCM